jgi:hypothetical protein
VCNGRHVHIGERRKQQYELHVENVSKSLNLLGTASLQTPPSLYFRQYLSNHVCNCHNTFTTINGSVGVSFYERDFWTVIVRPSMMSTMLMMIYHRKVFGKFALWQKKVLRHKTLKVCNYTLTQYNVKAWGKIKNKEQYMQAIVMQNIRCSEAGDHTDRRENKIGTKRGRCGGVESENTTENAWINITRAPIHLGAPTSYDAMLCTWILYFLTVRHCIITVDMRLCFWLIGTQLTVDTIKCICILLVQRVSTLTGHHQAKTHLYIRHKKGIHKLLHRIETHFLHV